MGVSHIRAPKLSAKHHIFVLEIHTVYMYIQSGVRRDSNMSVRWPLRPYVLKESCWRVLRNPYIWEVWRHFGVHDQIKVLTSCGYWETFTSEHSWTRVGQWLYEVVIRHILYAINKDNWGFFRWRLRWCWGSWCRRTPATWPPTWTGTSARSGNSKEPDFVSSLFYFLDATGLLRLATPLMSSSFLWR